MIDQSYLGTKLTTIYIIFSNRENHRNFNIFIMNSDEKLQEFAARVRLPNNYTPLDYQKNVL